MPKKIFTGQVVSTKMQKTVVVAVDMSKRHTLYGKVVKNTKRFKVRDKVGTKVGDLVKIEESRPLSKMVTWKVIEVINSAGEGAQ